MASAVDSRQNRPQSTPESIRCKILSRCDISGGAGRAQMNFGAPVRDAQLLRVRHGVPLQAPGENATRIVRDQGHDTGVSSAGAQADEKWSPSTEET